MVQRGGSLSRSRGEEERKRFLLAASGVPGQKQVKHANGQASRRGSEIVEARRRGGGGGSLARRLASPEPPPPRVSAAGQVCGISSSSSSKRRLASFLRRVDRAPARGTRGVVRRCLPRSFLSHSLSPGLSFFLSPSLRSFVFIYFPLLRECLCCCFCRRSVHLARGSSPTGFFCRWCYRRRALTVARRLFSPLSFFVSLRPPPTYYITRVAFANGESSSPRQSFLSYGCISRGERGRCYPYPTLSSALLSFLQTTDRPTDVRKRVCWYMANMAASRACFSLSLSLCNVLTPFDIVLALVCCAPRRLF